MLKYTTNKLFIVQLFLLCMHQQFILPKTHHEKGKSNLYAFFLDNFILSHPLALKAVGR